MELRVHAEDPLNDFFTKCWSWCLSIARGKGIRVDNGFEQGMDIPIYYDPMLAKLLTVKHVRKQSKSWSMLSIIIL
jgi:propionyl-CoA carboxylase alpha chain